MSGDKNEDVLQLLAEIARWTREAALPAVRDRVARLLDTEAKKRVYEAIRDGDATISAVEKATGTNHNDISAWLKVWDGEGVVERDTKYPKARFTLSELGIPAAPPHTPRPRKRQ